MSGSAEIRSALISRALAAAPGAALPQDVDTSGKHIFIDGLLEVFNPPAGKRWYRLAFIPGEPVPAALGDVAQNRHVGVFYVTVFWPTQGAAAGPTGITNGRQEAERIAQSYKRGTSFAYGGVNVFCEKAWVGQESTDVNFIGWPVKVQLYADVDN